MRVKRILSIILMTVMVLSVVPAFAYTGDVTSSDISTGSWSGTLISSDDPEVKVYQANTAPTNGLYIRTLFGTNLDGSKYSRLSFKVKPSVDTDSQIVLYEHSSYSDSSVNLRATLKLPDNKLKVGDYNQIDVIFSTLDKATKTQPALAYVNGEYVGNLHTATLGDSVSVKTWGKVILESTTKPDSTNPYTYSYKDCKTMVYPEDATLNEVISEVTSISTLPDKWDITGTIANRGYNTVTNNAGIYSIDFNPSTTTQQSSIYLNVNRTNGYDATYGPVSHIVKTFTLEFPADSKVTSIQSYVDGGSGTRSSFSVQPGNEYYFVVVCDLANLKLYTYCQNKNDDTKVYGMTATSQTNVILFNNSSATGYSNMAKLKDYNVTAINRNSTATLDSIKQEYFAPYLRESGKCTRPGTTKNDDGTYEYTVKDRLQDGKNYGFALELYSSVEKSNNANELVKCNFIHYHYDVEFDAYDKGEVKFNATHNVEFGGAQSVGYKPTINETYSVDAIFDFVNEKNYVYIDGVKIAENAMSARANASEFDYYFGDESAEENANQIYLTSANNATISNTYIDSYYENNTEIKTINNLLDKIFPGGTKEVAYNFVNDTTYADGKYIIKKEIFGYNMGTRLGTVASYDENGKLLAAASLGDYNSDVTLTSPEAASIKIFIWEDGTLKPLTAIKPVTIN